MKLLISLLFSLCPIWLADSAQADSQLYGLTQDGQLVAINKTSGASTRVLTLPSFYTGFRGVEYWPALGAFVASYNRGYILSFKLNGDVTNLGYSGYPFVDELSVRPDGKIFAVVSQNDERASWGNYDGACESLGELTWTGTIIIRAAPYQATVNGVGLGFRSIVYLDNTNFYAATISGMYAQFPYGYLDQLTTSDPYFTGTPGVYPMGAFVSWGILTGLAKDPDSSTIYGVDGYEPSSQDGAQPYTTIPSTLYRISYQMPNLPEQPIGATGFSGIVGLTFGPAVATPRPPRPMGLAAKFCAMGVICP